MKNKIKNIIIIINYTFLISAMVATAILSMNDSLMVLFLYLIVLTSYSVRTYFIYNTYEKETDVDINDLYHINNKDNMYNADNGNNENNADDARHGTSRNTYRKSAVMLLAFTYLLEVLVTIVLQKYDANLISFVIPVIIIEDIVVNTKRRISLEVSAGIYAVSCFILYFKLKNDSSRVVLDILLILVVYATTYIIFSLINYMLIQNEIIEYSLKNITIRNIEKDNLYRNLKEAYSKVETITALRERNKIAAEIHDTVGHTLTTVLVELEASKRLMNKDKDLALEKMNLAQNQVRKGLNDIRGSVRVLERGEDILDFYDSLEALIEDTEQHSEVVIKTSIDKDIKMNYDMGKMIFSALMEGLSNGIRHGRSTAFFFKLSHDDNKIYFSLQDNGKGTAVISPGFGLRAMRTRVEELKGTLDATSEEGQGFNLDITFPLNN